MATATVTSRSRNLGINATAYATNGPHGYHFDPLDHPEEQGGCATIRRRLDYYRRIWGTSTYYRIDLFVGGKRVSHDDGSFENLRDFCRDLFYGDDTYYPEFVARRRNDGITVTVED